ncbi:MAG TPA: hypothetical protein VGP07_23295 [Polyangia bacterium]|jgi:hypothetical protein
MTRESTDVQEQQERQEQLHDGWNEPRPATVPRPSAWPAGMALGITLLLWGIVTSPVLLAVGTLTVVASLMGWIGEMRHAQE